MEELEGNIFSHSTYVCDQNPKAVLEYQLQCRESGKKEIFDSNIFLNSIRNKQLGILGDSIMLLLYHSLRNQLYKHETSEVIERGNINLNTTEPHHWETAYVHYKEYNATIYWCRVPAFNINVSEPQESAYDYVNPEVWSDSVILHSQYLIVGVAAWFKPMFLYPFHTDYLESVPIAEQGFQNRIQSSRAYIKNMNRSLKVIWRLQPHVGPVDELELVHNITKNHFDGLLWSNASECSTWVPRYNHITVNVAKQYGDKVMDWYTLSNKYLNYFMGNKTDSSMLVHSDSLHYCARLLPRGAMLLVQHAIQSINSAHSTGTSVRITRKNAIMPAKTTMNKNAHHQNKNSTRHRHKIPTENNIDSF